MRESKPLSWDTVVTMVNKGDFDGETESFKESCIIGLRNRLDADSIKAVKRLTAPELKRERKKKI